MGFEITDLTDVSKLRSNQEQIEQVAIQEAKDARILDIKNVGSKGVNYLAAKYELSGCKEESQENPENSFIKVTGFNPYLQNTRSSPQSIN
jgi:hypothetical protein